MVAVLVFTTLIIHYVVAGPRTVRTPTRSTYNYNDYNNYRDNDNYQYNGMTILFHIVSLVAIKFSYHGQIFHLISEVTGRKF